MQLTRVFASSFVFVLLSSSVASASQQYSQRSPVWRGPFEVVEVDPAPLAMASPTTTVTVKFDRPVNPASVTPATFRVMGRCSGTATGTYTLSNGGRWVTFTSSGGFAAGEPVLVNLSHDVRASDSTPLRSAGYAYQFGVSAVPSTAVFTEIAQLDNNTGEQTRIYGACASDLNNDGYADLTTVNEVSADLRVFLNLADGTGSYSSFLAPTPIGVEASPSEAADFNNDGLDDLCVAASSSNSVYIALGAGDGTFSSVQQITVGSEPHGIVTLDVDGDGDQDVVNSNRVSNNLSLMINNGAGVFGSAAFFDGGVSGEYGLASGDMNGDGIMDLVVAGRDGSHVACRLGNGNGTFTSAGPAQPTGGPTWVIVLGDVDGDGDLDAATANSFNGTGAILKGNGNGTFGAPTSLAVGFHTPSVDLCDLDGDGDLDCVLSCFGGGFWRLYRNTGSGAYTFWTDFAAPNNPSCAVAVDFDNDGDVDLALSDEIADLVVLMKNQ